MLRLCWEFFKVGLFAVGGGLASIPFLYAMSDNFGWFSHELLNNMVAISESTPGPLGVNMATYVGYMVSGIPGGILASLALIVPSLVVVPLISMALQQFKDNQLVKHAFSALRAAVTGLIIYAAYLLLKGVLWGEGGIRWIELGVFVLFMVLVQLKPLRKLHPVAFIAAGAIVGMLLKL